MFIYGYEVGVVYVKEWYDFIGFMLDEIGELLGWVFVNYEMIYQDNCIGDGGGMMVFCVECDQVFGQLEVVEQELEDGCKGEFFNVDFVNMVGEIGMNCGGISFIVDGCIWIVEEWFCSNNSFIYNGGFFVFVSFGGFFKFLGGVENQGVCDILIYLIFFDIEGFDGLEVFKYENFNWMVEIDLCQVKVVCKQYNWGCQGFEGGVVVVDNQMVYFGVDVMFVFWVKFVVDELGDFIKGKIYIYKYDVFEKWFEVDNIDFEKMLNFVDQVVEFGGMMYNCVEWVVIDVISGKIYWIEIGCDCLGFCWVDENVVGVVYDFYYINCVIEKGIDSFNFFEYFDYYGCVWVYDFVIDFNYVFLEGGLDWDEEISLVEVDYFIKYLFNFDGLNVMMIDGQLFLVICEDFNGFFYGCMFVGISNCICELWLFDFSIE